MVRDPALALWRNHCLQIAQALGKPDPWASASRTFAPSNPTAARRPVLKRDPCAKGEFTFGSLPHGLWVHPEVPDGLGGMPPLRQRLGIVLQHLAAHGRTTVVKGCREAANRGWRRSPLGGNSGMLYYLWRTVQGSRPAGCIAFPGRGAVLVRAVRHHDLPFSRHEIEDADVVGGPWPADQLQFVRHEGPVRLVHGRRGSRKMTVLWKAVEARSGQRLLYLRWSRELTAAAQEHSGRSLPDVRVDRATSRRCWAGVRRDIVRLLLPESHALFAGAVARLGRRQPGPWTNRGAALHAEARAKLLGFAVPANSIPAGGLVRLSDATYRDRRAGRDGVGRATASALLKVAEHVDPTRWSASSRAGRRQRRLSVGCGTASCRKGSPSSISSSTMGSRT